MIDNPLNNITKDIIGCAFKIRNMYGRLMLESFYEQIMEIELSKLGYRVQRQVVLDIEHCGITVRNAYRIDAIVNECVIIEYKALSEMGGEEFRQLMTYLKLTGIRVGLLINFGAKDFSFGKLEERSSALRKGMYRVVNNL